MTLGEYIKILEKVPDKSRVLKKGLGEPASWRGRYEELAFDIVENITIQEMLECAQDCIGKTFTGYKGGDYVFDENTNINIDSCGDWSDGKAMWSFFMELLLAESE